MIEVWGVRPDLLLIFVLVLAERNGALAGLAAGFFGGLFQDATSVGIAGVMALAKCSIGFWAGRWLAYRDAALATWGWAGLMFGATVFQGALQGLFILQGSSYSYGSFLLASVLPTALFTAGVAYIWAISPFSGRGRPAVAPARIKARKKFR